MGGHPQARRLCAAAVWSLLLCAGLAGADPADRQGLFPPQSTVVLVSGVPGDVESEEKYRDQLQSWLELATGSGQAARIFVLCDDPQAVTLPESPDLQSAPKEAERAPEQQADHPVPVTHHESPLPSHRPKGRPEHVPGAWAEAGGRHECAGGDRMGSRGEAGQYAGAACAGAADHGGGF